MNLTSHTSSRKPGSLYFLVRADSIMCYSNLYKFRSRIMSVIEMVIKTLTLPEYNVEEVIEPADLFSVSVIEG